MVPCQSDRKDFSFEWSLELKSYNQHSCYHFIWEEKGQSITWENSRSQTAPLNQMIQYQMCHNKIIREKQENYDDLLGQGVFEVLR